MMSFTPHQAFVVRGEIPIVHAEISISRHLFLAKSPILWMKWMKSLEKNRQFSWSLHVFLNLHSWSLHFFQCFMWFLHVFRRKNRDVVHGETELPLDVNQGIDRDGLVRLIEVFQILGWVASDSPMGIWHGWDIQYIYIINIGVMILWYSWYMIQIMRIYEDMIIYLIGIKKNQDIWINQYFLGRYAPDLICQWVIIASSVGYLDISDWCCPNGVSQKTGWYQWYP